MKRLIKLIFAILLILSPASLWTEHYEFVSLEYAPITFINSDEKVTGISVDIVKKIMTNLGHTVNIKVYPWARSLMMVKAGSADAIFTAFKTPERESFLDYSKNILLPQTVSLYVNNNSAIEFHGDLTKIKEYKIGIVNTMSYGNKFDSIRNELKLVRVENLLTNFKLLETGIADIAISSTFVGDYTLNQAGIQNKFRRLPQPVQSVDSFIAFSKVKKLSGLRDDFDKELEKLIANGTYDEILSSYGIRK